MPRKITVDQKRLVFERIDAGYSYRESAVHAGVSLSTVQSLVKGHKQQRVMVTQEKMEVNLKDPIPYHELSKEAKRGWDDFAFFQERYFGRIPIPWQQEAAERVVTLLESPREEYEVVNCPPGSGKTLLFTHDIPAWLTVRNRAIRGQMGSATGDLAAKLTRRLRSTLESVLPVKAELEALKAGTAIDAVATLAGDYGRFRPIERELWTVNQFTVVQPAGYRSVEKEATWTSYGFDQGFLGGRFDFIVWDDLVDPKKNRTPEARALLEESWDDLAETRLEPRGLLLLQGQRLFSTDLYRYNLDKIIPDDIDEETGEAIGDVPKYGHIKFKAHYEDRCSEGSHRLDAPAYPQGCLLSPRRLSWRKISAAKRNNPHYETVYQQEDTDPHSVLVDPAWVPKCLDESRDRLQLPRDASGRLALAGPLFSIATVDPSPSMMWGIEWWVYQPDTEMWWLMDLVRQKMDAPDFLGQNDLTREYYGIANEWQQTSRELLVPITHWVVEINAAQKFLLQYEWVRNWAAKNSVHIVPHTTGRNKTDPELGVETIAPHWEFGRIRLPYKVGSEGRRLSNLLIEEVTAYPNGRYNDLVMAEWFCHFNVPKLYHKPKPLVRQKRPSWIRDPKLFTRY